MRILPRELNTCLTNDRSLLADRGLGFTLKFPAFRLSDNSGYSNRTCFRTFGHVHPNGIRMCPHTGGRQQKTAIA